MSAPDTDVKEQEHRHRPSLWGMAIAVAFAAILLVLLTSWIFFQGNDPDEAEAQVDGRTGEVEQVE
ncbi:hypothetical protein [Histidinibacterium aquaticum]|uniref:Uncharacterized protein n=1 Tax=Histidinibacterium aquaticum TaxID=2613962 RepID=A0A5J5GI71_9RHOB|nr:hypothetical protein [Histidinibacterium aquaticum]KAA9007901.1 hypothetical protein F3S47_10270 [Histidinibacterium aquaticum]